MQQKHGLSTSWNASFPASMSAVFCVPYSNTNLFLALLFLKLHTTILYVYLPSVWAFQLNSSPLAVLSLSNYFLFSSSLLVRGEACVTWHPAAPHSWCLCTHQASTKEPPSPLTGDSMSISNSRWSLRGSLLSCQSQKNSQLKQLKLNIRESVTGSFEQKGLTQAVAMQVPQSA